MNTITGAYNQTHKDTVDRGANTINNNIAHNTDVTLWNQTPSLGSLEAYINWTKSLPIPSQMEEQQLTQRLYYKNDLTAARQLVISHLRFVIHIAQGYYGYGLPLEDLIQVGNVGLMKAVKRFNPAVGVRLITFAVHWIKAEIHEFVLRNWRIVKVATTKAQRKLFFNLRKSTNASRWLSAGETKNIAKELRVTPQEVAVMESRLLERDVPFSVRGDSETDNDNGGNSHPEDYLMDDNNNPYTLLAESNWTQDRMDKLTAALASIDARSRDIVEQRWLHETKATLHDLAQKYRVSLERIRQIEEQAMKKIKQYLLQTE